MPLGGDPDVGRKTCQPDYGRPRSRRRKGRPHLCSLWSTVRVRQLGPGARRGRLNLAQSRNDARAPQDRSRRDASAGGVTLVPLAVTFDRRCRQAGIARGIIVVMAMTLRLDEQETDALRQRAAREGRSMQDVARQAVRDYIDRTSKRELLDDVLDEEIPRYAEALRRLGE
jgi:plasmid stability protein